MTNPCISKTIIALNAKHRANFMRKMRYRFHLSPEDAEDLFQDAMLLLCEKLKNGKLPIQEDFLRFYLLKVGYVIGRRKLHANIAKRSRLSHIGQKTHETAAVQEACNETGDVAHVLDHLKTHSKRLLKLYYFDGYCMEAIAREMNYKNPDVAKAQKHRCLKEFSAAYKQMLHRA